MWRDIGLKHLQSCLFKKPAAMLITLYDIDLQRFATSTAMDLKPIGWLITLFKAGLQIGEKKTFLIPLPNGPNGIVEGMFN